MSQKQSTTTTKRAQKKSDIIQLILEDHKPLKKLLKIMKNLDNEVGEREAAFKKFVPLLLAHAKPEEQTLYTVLKKEDDEDLRVEGFEGEVEHQLADLMAKQSKSAKDEDVWSARVKVLAELVEHHIKEEEEDVFPEYKKNSDIEERSELGKKYLMKQSEFLAKQQRPKAPRSEASEQQMPLH
jgi:hemerythrin superfamily protein